MAAAYGLSEQSPKIINLGYPRNDKLFHGHDARSEAIKRLIPGAVLGKKVVLYAPTWRDHITDSDKECHCFFNQQKMRSFGTSLGPGVVVFLKTHQMNNSIFDTEANQDQNSAAFYDVSSIVDINEVFLITDLLISDYSGAIFDFALLKRPQVFYMWDKEAYSIRGRGVDFNFNDLPGPIVERSDDLGPIVKNALSNFSYDEKYARFNSKYNNLETGHSCRDFAKKFFL
jgi:CDP-glycerol glycerophosphotransferase